ncbi:MAG: chalcone isomerase family protein [Desulfobacteraceae bacterium]|nr:chalcone isomerase family protein [Desulfobacteraceae bacterium]MCB9495171.1 chalcone isomerase family protein [Desulfobacteraceae bacterium]
MKRLLAVLIISFMLASTVSAQEVGGINFSDQMTISGKNMVLNGAGLRKKAFIKVYACGLYLNEKSSDANAIINADDPMAIRLVITTGLVSKEKMQSAMTEGFEASTNGNQAALQSQIDAFNKCFSDEIVKEDEFLMTYVPGTGVVVSKNGTEKGVIQGLDFKKALFGIWLGDKPADDDLKEDMI